MDKCPICKNESTFEKLSESLSRCPVCDSLFDHNIFGAIQPPQRPISVLDVVLGVAIVLILFFPKCF